jgi:hypothetical protein
MSVSGRVVPQYARCLDAKAADAVDGRVAVRHLELELCCGVVDPFWSARVLVVTGKSPRSAEASVVLTQSHGRSPDDGTELYSSGRNVDCHLIVASDRCAGRGRHSDDPVRPDTATPAVLVHDLAVGTDRPYAVQTRQLTELVFAVEDQPDHRRHRPRPGQAVTQLFTARGGIRPRVQPWLATARMPSR